MISIATKNNLLSINHSTWKNPAERVREMQTSCACLLSDLFPLAFKRFRPQGLPLPGISRLRLEERIGRRGQVSEVSNRLCLQRRREAGTPSKWRAEQKPRRQWSQPVPTKSQLLVSWCVTLTWDRHGCLLNPTLRSKSRQYSWPSGPQGNIPF